MPSTNSYQTENEKGCLMADSAQSESPAADRLTWWRQARFGMFIHWGLYAVAGGEWQGERVEGIAEWVMCRARIPLAEYRQLAALFNPEDFDAEKIAKLADKAGMKYLVITAKHHDGFAMFHSRVDKDNIVDATPYGRDPLWDLAVACRQRGIRLGFYYSQDQDWAEYDASGNNWDWPADRERDFQGYLDRKVKPQLRELLTHYGPVCLIWFDTPVCITPEQSAELRDFVHALQPDCLVSGRVGNDMGDYGSLGDNQIPPATPAGDWETPATLNDTWGYSRHDDNWKDSHEVIERLADLASKGVNYLLNIGPDERGAVPKPSRKTLKNVGKWMRDHGEAIHGSRPSPWPYTLPGLRVTRGDRRLYLILTAWPERPLRLHGLRSRVARAWFLGAADEDIACHQDHDQGTGIDLLRIDLPKKPPHKHIPVLALDLAEDARVDERILQRPDRAVLLGAWMADIASRGTGGVKTTIDRAGVTSNWRRKSDWLTWRFVVLDPDRFLVKVWTSVPRRQTTIGGHRISVHGADQHLNATLAPDEENADPIYGYRREFATHLGVLTLDEAGEYELSLRAEEIDRTGEAGILFSRLELLPVEG